MLPKRQRKDKHLAVAAYLQDGLGSRRARDRRGRGLALSRGLPARAGRADDAERGEGQGPRAPRPSRRACSRARGLPRRRGATSSRHSSSPRTPTPVLRSRSVPGRWPGSPVTVEQARAHFERAIAMLDAAGRTHASARVTARLGDLDYFEGRHDGGASTGWNRPSRCSSSEEHRRGRRRARGRARPAPLLHRRPRARRRANRVRARSRREARPPRAALAGSQHQGRDTSFDWPQPRSGGSDSPFAAVGLGRGAQWSCAAGLQQRDHVSRVPRQLRAGAEPGHGRCRARTKDRRQDLGDGSSRDTPRTAVVHRALE